MNIVLEWFRQTLAARGIISTPFNAIDRLYAPSRSVVTESMLSSYTKEVAAAVVAGDVAAMKQALAIGLDPNAQNSFGVTLLHRAARNGHLSVVEMLLQAGALPFGCDDGGKTIIHDACWSASSSSITKAIPIVLLLVKNAPWLFLAADIRGSVPFDYIPVSERMNWIEQLAPRIHGWCDILLTMLHSSRHGIPTASMIASVSPPAVAPMTGTACTPFDFSYFGIQLDSLRFSSRCLHIASPSCMPALRSPTSTSSHSKVGCESYHARPAVLKSALTSSFTAAAAGDDCISSDSTIPSTHGLASTTSSITCLGPAATGIAPPATISLTPSSLTSRLLVLQPHSATSDPFGAIPFNISPTRLQKPDTLDMLTTYSMGSDELTEAGESNEMCDGQRTRPTSQSTVIMEDAAK